MTGDERALLEFEEAHPRQSGRKQADIRTQFGYTEARYYQVLFRLIRRPDVVEAFPSMTKRLLRLSEARRSARAARQPSALS